MKRFLSLLLSVILIFSTAAVALDAHAASLSTVQIQGKYHQSQARALLKKVNALRTGNNRKDAWAWNYNNTRKIEYKNLTNFTYDYELEQIAMQRAAEIAVYYGAEQDSVTGQQYHKRPNDTYWNSAHTRYNEASGYSIGENLFVAVNCDAPESMERAFEAWLEADKNYDGQWHRRNMLSVPYSFVSTAYACFEIKGIFYWVGLFRSANINPTPTTVSSAEQYVGVQLSDKFVKSFTLSDTATSLTLGVGETADIVPTGHLVTLNHLITLIDSTGKEVPYPTILRVTPKLTTSDPTVLQITGNQIRALKAGTATVTATLFSASLRYTVEVQPSDLSPATITLDQSTDTYIYTGNPILPQIQSVKLGNHTIPASEYTVTYSDNVGPGTGYLTIVGKNNYTGFATKSFKIVKKEDCQHHAVYDAPVAASCIVRGKSAGTHCDICGKVLTPQEDYGYGEHIIIYDPKIEPTCIQEGFSQGAHCALCGAVTQRPVSLGYGEHKSVKDPAVKPTCETAGKTEGSHCSICNAVFTKQTAIPALGHSWSANKLQKATLNANGKIYRSCTHSGCKKTKTIKVIYRPKDFSLFATNFIYNGKVQRPKFVVKGADNKTISAANFAYSIPASKNVGVYKIVIKFKGYYSGTKYLYYYIRPKNVAAFTLASTSKGFKVKWTTQKVQTKGYQIQYSLYPDFRSAKTITLKNNRYTAAGIGKLAGGKRYYVRIRTYQTVKSEGKAVNVFSFWSGKRAVITKK